MKKLKNLKYRKNVINNYFFLVSMISVEVNVNNEGLIENI